MTRIRRSLETLRDAASADAAFWRMLDAAGQHIESVLCARGQFAQCHPEALRGTPTRIAAVGEFALRAPAAVGVSRYRLAAQGAGSRMPARWRSWRSARRCWCRSASRTSPRACSASAFGLPRGGFDVNLQLLMKLLGTSLATGLERMRLSHALERIEERNALAELAANDGLWDFDVEGNDVYFSPRWRAMLGYDEADLKGGFDWRSLVHPDDMSRVQSAIREHVAGKTPIFESVHRMRHRNGEWRWVISRAKAQLDAHGRLLRLVGVELDITERKLYEEALFREKESAQITLQSIGDGVITTDAASTIDYINPVAEQLTGWRLEDAMGRPVEEIFRAFHEETCEPLENPLTVSIRRARPIKSVRPMLLIRRDGNELYVESTASPIRAGNGKVGGGVLVFHDVSESRELNRRLSYHASHDLLTGLVNRREFENRLERALQERQGARGLLCAVLPGHRSVQDRQRHLRPQRRRCAARPGRRAAEVQGALARHAVAPRAATSSASCSRAARSMRRCAWPSRCARRCAISASAGRSACFASAPASAWCRSRPTTRTWPRSCRPPTAPARRPRSRAATACTASPRTTSS